MVESARLAGKRALVTGGGRGIGAAIARRLAAEGAAVAVNYVADAASADALVRELTEAGHRAVAFRADVEDPAQTQDLVKRVRAEFGGGSICWRATPGSNTSALSNRSPRPVRWR
jgi:3-oxoacyl-[acyl-carrier protein] reductase